MNKYLVIMLCFVVLIGLVLATYLYFGGNMSSNVAEGKKRTESAILNTEVSGEESQDTVKSWTPTKQDLANFEKTVFEQLKRERKYRIAKRFDDYKCQYLATISEDGSKKIYGNYFIGDFENWQTQPVLVLDGGENFFQATYNFTTNDIEITVNGQA